MNRSHAGFPFPLSLVVRRQTNMRAIVPGLPGKRSDNLAPGTLSSILKQASEIEGSPRYAIAVESAGNYFSA